MTLLASEISRFGVVMVADTAETRQVQGRSGRNYSRTVFGTAKLFPIPVLGGGVSFWGAGEIYVDAPDGRGRMPTDVWLEDFIASNSHFKTLEEFAFTLRREISVTNEEAPQLGFQVAGVGKGSASDASPVFYRVCNFDRKGGMRPTFDVDRDDVFPHLTETSYCSQTEIRHCSSSCGGA